MRRAEVLIQLMRGDEYLNELPNEKDCCPDPVNWTRELPE
jgi:hypothetical protein